MYTDLFVTICRTYYDPVEGSRYTFGRLPIAASDFSPRRYELDYEVNDVSLKNFSLEAEDFQFKIPFLQKALKINPKIRLLGAAWSAPGWMKTNRHFNGFGKLGSIISKEGKATITYWR